MDQGIKGRRDQGMKGAKDERSKGIYFFSVFGSHLEVLKTLWGMESTYQLFEDLVIWQEGMKICYQIYDALEQCHDFGLRNQMERSAVSVPSNIAEGYELSSDRAFIRHLYIAKGSAAELRTQLYIAIRQKYISQEIGTELLAHTKKLSGMIQKFINARKKRALKNFMMKVLSYLL